MLIYRITNQVNGKSYVGLTSSSLDRRWRSHRNALRKFQECSAGGFSSALYSAMVKYGPENFNIEPICSVLRRDDLGTMEAELIDRLGTLSPFGYNLKGGGDRGFIATPEMVERIRFGRKKGKQVKWDQAARNAHSEKFSGDKNPFFGKNHAQDSISKANTSRARSRMTKSPEVVAKIKAAQAAAFRNKVKYLTDPSGYVWAFRDEEEFCRNNGLIRRLVARVRCGDMKSHLGWTRAASDSAFEGGYVLLDWMKPEHNLTLVKETK
jgi:group I intron endonuclease